MQELLTYAGGTNWYGEPMYRFIWGWNRIELIGGKWTDHDPVTGAIVRETVEMRRVPKYSSPLFDENRWYVERWYSPERFGSRAKWEAQTIEVEGAYSIPAMGPYPSRGDYKHFFTIENKQHGFLQLTWPRAIWMAGVVWTSERAHKKTLAQQKDAIAAQEAKEQAQRLEELDATIPAFDYQPTVTVL